MGTTVFWGLAGIAGAVVLAGFAEIWYKRHRKTPLSAIRPKDMPVNTEENVPLGQEATDLRTFNQVVTMNDRLTAQTSQLAGPQAKDKHDRAANPGIRRRT